VNNRIFIRGLAFWSYIYIYIQGFLQRSQGSCLRSLNDTLARWFFSTTRQLFAEVWEVFSRIGEFLVDV
jgi:hypothetical protein